MSRQVTLAGQAPAGQPIAPNTLHIYSDGKGVTGWAVERPHYTGSDWGPAYSAGRGKYVPAADLQKQIDFYGRAGFRISDPRCALSRATGSQP